MGRKSIIDKWPDELRDPFFASLRDTSLTHEDRKEFINDLIDELGLKAKKISTSSVSREFQNMEEIGKQLREAREVAAVWVEKLGSQPQGKVGLLLNEMIQTLVFKLTGLLQKDDIETEDIPDLMKILNTMALTLQRLERASAINVKREEEIRKQVLEEAADNVEDAAISRGMNKEEAGYWRQQVLQGR